MGKWRERDTGLASYFSGGVVNCNVCGKMIPREIWEVEIDGTTFSFCDETCEQLYVEYWLPRHKHQQADSSVSA